MPTYLGPQKDALQWKVTEPGLHVCDDHARRVGYVVRVDGAFIAFDDASTPLGRYQRLRAAKQAVETIPARRSMQ